jgi:hypothetical protein
MARLAPIPYTYSHSAIVIDRATGALLRKVCALQGAQRLDSSVHLTAANEQWIDLDDPNDLSDATIAAKILAVTGKVMPQPTHHVIADAGTGMVLGVIMAHAGINDHAPPGTFVVPLASLTFGTNCTNWTQWTIHPQTKIATIPTVPVPVKLST